MPDPEALVGRTLGHYSILERLGEGGMGVVFRARDTRLGRLAALKIMRPDRVADEDRRRLFVREARAASALNHPNILTIYEIDTDAGVDYIAMEYVEGGTLADLVAHGPIPADRALRLASQVADALAAAHAAGVVHRDLKPSNIMLAAGERVKVVDFGLARFAGAALPTEETVGTLASDGAVVGTVPYMSPEQAAGAPRTHGATCSASARSCTRCWRAGARSPATPRSASWRRSCGTRQRRLRASPPTWPDSSSAASARTSPGGSSPRPSSRPPSTRASRRSPGGRDRRSRCCRSRT